MQQPAPVGRAQSSGTTTAAQRPLSDHRWLLDSRRLMPETSSAECLLRECQGMTTVMIDQRDTPSQFGAERLDLVATLYHVRHRGQFLVHRMELVAEPSSFPRHLERLPYHDGEHTDEYRAAVKSDPLPSSGPIRCRVRSRPTANTSMRIIDRPPGRQRPTATTTVEDSDRLKNIKGLLDLQEQILGHGLDDRGASSAPARSTGISRYNRSASSAVRVSSLRYARLIGASSGSAVERPSPPRAARSIGRSDATR